MDEKHNWNFDTLTDKDLTSLKEAIYEEEDRRKNKKVKTAFETFEKTAIDLDKILDTYYDIAGDDYTMEGIIDAVRYSIQIAGYDI